MSSEATPPTGPELPETLSIFPLPGVILLPDGQLPLNIFEPRYLDMVRDAMGAHRVIGMVQPLDPADRSRAPEVYDTGGAGRITAFQETGDGRFLITLSGVSRFKIAEELSVTTRYRQIVPDWAGFAADPAGRSEDGDVDREHLLQVLRGYFAALGIGADLDAAGRAPSTLLVNTMAMLCPFTPGEKQALLEAPEAGERSRLMIALMEMAIAQRTAGLSNDASRH